MNRVITAVLAIGLSTSIAAQELPKPSPSAKTSQRIGLIDVGIEYSRPGIKGRTIWGDLVPYGELWRAGANKATAFTTSGEIIFGGKHLAPGPYSMFIIPREKGAWEVILNEETELWGTGKYNQDFDAVRVEVIPQKLDNVNERLEFHFTEVETGYGVLAMDWAGVRLSIKIEADPFATAMDNITAAINEAEPEELWKVYRTAASYAGDAGVVDQGLKWIEESIKLQENWYSSWIHAELLAKSGNKEGAIGKAEEAIAIGKKDAEENNTEFTYEERIRKDIAKWQE